MLYVLSALQESNQSDGHSANGGHGMDYDLRLFNQFDLNSSVSSPRSLIRFIADFVFSCWLLPD